MSDVVALSGGADSTAMAVLLVEREPRSYKFVCTPTGDELPEMEAHWSRLEERLGSLIRLPTATLDGLIEQQNALPNWRQRWCTRILKIEPFVDILQRLAQLGPVTSYVGIRADEKMERGVFYGVDGVTERFPLREWGMNRSDVLDCLAARGICIPERTDCAKCFFQTLGEWFNLWRDHPDRYQKAVLQEQATGHTFRSPGRDKWPAGLAELRGEFERGRIPKGWGQGDMLRQSQCRACSL